MNDRPNTLVIGFMLFAPTRRGAPFDRRPVLGGYTQPVLLLAILALGIFAWRTRARGRHAPARDESGPAVRVVTSPLC